MNRPPHLPSRKLTLLKEGQPEHTDLEYIRGVHQGDTTVFTNLVSTHLDTLTRYAFSMLGDEDAAHDIVQDVFARIWQLGVDWNPTGQVTAYLFVAVRRRALNVLRDSHARTQASDAIRRYLEGIVTQLDPYADVALGRRVAKEIGKLTDRQRDALRLRYGHDQTMPQVAEILEIDVKAAERLVSRALSALRDRLKTVREELDDESVRE